jgi:hypothetical protein
MKTLNHNFKINNMKKIILIITMLFLTNSMINAQTGEVSITTVNDGTNIDISVFIRRTGGVSWNMGEGSFVFNFNTSAVNISGATILTRGQWDGTNNSNYGSMFTAPYGGVARSLETTLNLNPGGVVPTTATLVGVLRMPITNAAANHNITWHTTFSAIQTDGSDEVTLTFVNPPNTPLPVELVNFTGNTDRNNVKLSWATVSEINNSGFDIERKPVNAPVEIWSKIGNVNGYGNSTEQKNYSYNDNGLQTGKYAYRLKQIDYNGNFEYFNLSSEIEVGVPKEFSLSQNYPNPFNPTTKIDYDIPFDSRINLKVYDMTGKEIASLVNNNFQNAGYYTVQLNGANMASGIYFFRIIAQSTNGKDFVMTKKMVLMK